MVQELAFRCRRLPPPSPPMKVNIPWKRLVHIHTYVHTYIEKDVDEKRGVEVKRSKNKRKNDERKDEERKKKKKTKERYSSVVKSPFTP